MLQVHAVTRLINPEIYTISHLYDVDARDCYHVDFTLLTLLPLARLETPILYVMFLMKEPSQHDRRGIPCRTQIAPPE